MEIIKNGRENRFWSLDLVSNDEFMMRRQSQKIFKLRWQLVFEMTIGQLI